MKMLKITNQATQVNRLSLEKLGLSTKRDNDETIGQFGSGIKFAPIAAIRKGMKFVFTGNDSRGGYALEYVVKNEDGIDCIFYDYGDYEKPSSFTVDAGVLSWESEFQIYREVVANAIDSTRETGLPWSSEIVNAEDIAPVEGEFSVYISATPEIMEVHNNFDKYFCVNRQPIAVTNAGNIYHPIDDKFRVYCKGVLVYTHDDDEFDIQGIYDYEFNSITLNEERRVRSTYDIGNSIGRFFYELDDESIVKQTLKRVLDQDELVTKLYEIASVASYVYDTYRIQNLGEHSVWQKSFDQISPGSVIVDSADASVNALTSIRGKGYNPVVIKNDSLFYFLKTKSIKTIEDILGNSYMYEYEMGFENVPKLNFVMNIIRDIFPSDYDEIKDSVGVFTPPSEDTLGITVDVNNDGSRVILIAKDHIKQSTTESLIATVIHEADHFISGWTDGNMEGRMFRNLADNRIGELVYELWLIRNKNNK